jgi:2-polyprenyl-3-methyl-5-hydroxy-6-metoxy-1,4-benzoquinol methylase
MHAELIEDVTGSIRLYRRTLEQFALINRLLSGSRGLIRRHALRPMLRCPEKTYTFLDVGCGSADLSRWILRIAARRGLNLRVVALDYDARAVEVARDLSADLPGLVIRQGDVRSLEMKADFVFCNHLLHHFEDEEIPVVLRSLRSAAGLRVIVNDVRRSALAYVLFWFFATVFLRGSHHRHDGRLSILKGLRAGELRSILEAADLGDGARVSVRPIARLRLVMDVGAQD